jgi:hypothetical protein
MACSRARPSYLGTMILVQSLSTGEGMSATLEGLNVALPLNLSQQSEPKGGQTPDA